MYFLFVPGFHSPSGSKIVQYVPNLNICAKSCYLDETCIGFGYPDRVCVLYHSFAGGTRTYIYLWVKISNPGKIMLLL